MKRLFKGGPGPRTRPSGSPTKMSEALLEFAWPLLDDLPAGTPFDRVRAMVGFAVIAWDSVVQAQLAGSPEPMEMMRARISAQHPAEFLSLFDWLVERKRRYFADDRRDVLWYHVSMSRGELHLDALGVGPGPEGRRGVSDGAGRTR